MICEDIHNKLKDKEVRDFLAIRFVEEGRACSWNIDTDYIEKQLKELQEQLKHANALKCIEHLIEINGWSPFDISVYVQYDEEDYIPFIGTEEEYRKMIERLTVVSKDK